MKAIQLIDKLLSDLWIVSKAQECHIHFKPLEAKKVLPFIYFYMYETIRSQKNKAQRKGA